MQNLFISILAIAAYLTTGILIGWRVFGQKTVSTKSFISENAGLIVLGLIAVSLHGFALYQNLITPTGINLGLFNAISLITWLIALTLMLACITNPVESLAVFFLPVAGIAILMGMVFPVDHTILTAQAVELKLHILLSILAYSLLTIAAVHSIILAIQDRQLRNRHPGGFIRALPPLQTMETLLFQMIGLGFFLHSLSLITGVIYLEDIFAQHLVHKTLLSVVAWLLFATLLWGRWRFGWRGKVAIRWTLGGCFSLALAYIGSKWVLEIILA